MYVFYCLFIKLKRDRMPLANANSVYSQTAKLLNDCFFGMLNPSEFSNLRPKRSWACFDPWCDRDFVLALLTRRHVVGLKRVVAESLARHCRSVLKPVVLDLPVCKTQRLGWKMLGSSCKIFLSIQINHDKWLTPLVLADFKLQQSH